jgi:hypothetical protein
MNHSLPKFAASDAMSVPVLLVSNAVSKRRGGTRQQARHTVVYQCEVEDSTLISDQRR